MKTVDKQNINPDQVLYVEQGDAEQGRGNDLILSIGGTRTRIRVQDGWGSDFHRHLRAFFYAKLFEHKG